MTIARCYHVDRKKGRCRRSYHWGGLHVYAELPKVGAAKARTLVAEGLFREEVAARADGWCEATSCIRPEGGWVCWDRRHLGAEAHHIWPEDRDRALHDPARGLWLCHVAHVWVTEHPAPAAVLGLMRPDPTDAA